MIGYFIKVGDEETSRNFTPYIREETGIKGYIGKLRDYANNDLRLILIMYYVEGKFPVNGPDGYKLNNYSSKDKSISIAHTIGSDFWELSERCRKQYIVDSTIRAIGLAKDRLQKKGLEVDFDEIEIDFRKFSSEWISK